MFKSYPPFRKHSFVFGVFFLLICSSLATAQPTISSFSPVSGPVGTTVTISGTNFSTTPANNIVFFGAVKANVTAASATSLTVSVPAGATYQPISVLVNGLIANSSQFFVVTFAGGAAINSESFVYAGDVDSVHGRETNDMVASDFDGDGKVDMAAVDRISATISVYQNVSTTNNVSFAPPVNYFTLDSPQNIAIGDIDGDGKPDLVVTKRLGSGVSVFRNTSTVGTISFAPKVDFATSAFPASIAIADFNGDGKLDMAIDCFNSGAIISVLANTSSVGVISFAAKKDFTVFGDIIKMVANDLDGDSKPDIALIDNIFNSIGVMRNTSSGTTISFASKIDFATGQYPFDIAVGDVDLDGKRDLVSANFDAANISVFRNTSTPGSISFATRINYSTNTKPASIAIGDLDGDGKPDLAAHSNDPLISSSSLSVYRNTCMIGTISFSPKTDYRTFGYTILLIAEIDGNGRPDIISGGSNINRGLVFRNKVGAPRISSFTPTSANTGATVTINGDNFIGTIGVSFGGVPATSFIVVNSTTITAVVGAGASGDIVVTNSMGSGALSGFIFTAPPTITSFLPVSAGTGQTVTITGTNFTPATLVSFGGVSALSFNVVNSTTIKAIVGTGASGNIVVTSPYGSSSLPGFTYIQPPPTIVSFTPMFGGTGSNVQISGTNFIGVTSVSFGGVPASSFTVVNSTTIRAVVDTGSSGAVSVATPAGNVSLAGFIYVPPPILTSFTPTSGGTNTSIILTGTNLSNVNGVYFGGVPASSFTKVNSTTISAYVGTGASGNVAVSSAFGNSSLPGFTYLQAPSITSFSPTSGAPGTNVTITGTNFWGITKISFGGTPVASFTVVDSTTINVVTGLGNSGTITIHSSFFGSRSSTSDFTFVYPPPGITSFSPSSGTTGTSITITGSNFTSVPGVGVQFGGVSASSVMINSATSLTAVVGNGASGDVRIITKGGEASIPGFTYNLPAPTVTSFSPVNAGAGTAVTITGTNFTDATSVSFGGTAASSFIVRSSTTIAAIVGGGSSGNVSVTTPSGTGSYRGFTHYAPVISSFSPTSGGPGTVVTITGSGFINTLFSIMFGGVPAASYTVNSANKITAIVGANGATGDISVITKGATASLPGFTFTPTGMSISSVFPSIASNGVSVTITGYNFTGATSVSFGGIAASSFVVNSSSNITAVVGTGASGNVSVTTPTGGTATYADFIYTYAPVITSFVPESATVGSTVTISGANFNTSITGNIVYFGAVRAEVKSASANSLAVSVPIGATYQPITVTCNGLTTFSQKYFKLTFAAIGSINSASFAPKIDSSTGSTPNHVSVSDIDNDGKIDVTASNHSIGAPLRNIVTFKNNGNSGSISFEAKNIIKGGYSPRETFYADIDGDGKLDIVSGNDTYYRKPASIYRNTSVGGTISFSNEINLDGVPNLGDYDIAVGDLNGDGKPEVAAVGYSGGLGIFKNTSTVGNISFAAPITQSAGSIPQSMVMADIDMDGKLDLVYEAGGDVGTVTILRNTSTSDVISFAPSIKFDANLYTRSLAVGDIDGDGKNDVVLTNEYSRILTVFLNTSTPGKISFANKVEYLTEHPPYGVTITDLDGNGKPDIIVTNIYNSSISVFDNTSTIGSISLAPKIEFATGREPSSVAIGDFDSDGRPDIVTSNLSGGTLSFLRNQINGVFITSFTPTNGSAGTVVNITGTNFTGATTVSFGDVAAASFVVNSSTSITAVLANGASGKVSVTTPMGTASLGGYIFVPAPLITSFSPVSAGAGTTVTITGQNFTGATAVSFGGVAATSFSIVNTTTITAIVGNATSGNVIVTTPGGTTSLSGFTFIPAPVITSFNPSSASPGTTVTITGQNFTGTTAVSFGGVASTSFNIVNTTTITAIVGNGASGSVNVTTSGGTGTLPGFIFIPPPTITSFTPISATTGETVTITGQNFTGATTVSFGGTTALSYTVVGPTTIIAVVGTGTSGSVSVIAPGGTGGMAGFTYNNITQLKISPNPATNDFIEVKHPVVTTTSRIRIINMNGNMVRDQAVPPNAYKTTIPIVGLNKGIYLVVWSDGNTVLTQRLIIAR